MELYVEPPGVGAKPLSPQWDTSLPMAVAIGMFDGVHIGHRSVIRQLRMLASQRGLCAGAITFAVHPATVVRPESAPELLTPLDAKVGLLGNTGLDRVAVLQFDLEHSQESAEAFVERVLCDGLNCRTVVVGEDFHFGKDRQGNVALLDAMGRDRGFDVVGIDLVSDGDQHAARPISSTRIRAAIGKGDVAEAHALLGRPHELAGIVERGDQRGREWGFPTANLVVASNLVVPANGIYAAWVLGAGDDPEPAAVYVGNRPTVYGESGQRVVEAHLLNFGGDLYDRELAVRFIARIRGDEAFASFEDLVAQIRRDCDDARAILESA